MFVAECPEESLPQGLFPAGLLGSGPQLAGLGFQPDVGCLTQEFRSLVLREGVERRGALSVQADWRRAWLFAQAEPQFL